MDSSISHVVSHNTFALSLIIHDQIHSEVLNEEDAIVAKSSTKKSVQHRVPGSVGNSAASVSLSTFAVVS